MDDFDNFLYDDYGGNDLEDEQQNFTQVKYFIK
jgi:hypothetical protein